MNTNVIERERKSTLSVSPGTVSDGENGMRYEIDNDNNEENLRPVTVCKL